jgi:hypothetical protein
MLNLFILGSRVQVFQHYVDGMASFPRNCLRTERDTGMFPPCAWIPLSAPIVAAAEQSAVKSLEWLRSSGR